MAHNKKHGKTARWVERQNRDPHVIAARQAGFRARSVFKLEQIDRKYRLIKPASRIVDLGSAPGSWSQYAAARVRAENRIIAVDLLAMKAIKKVKFIRGDFTTDAVVERILRTLDERPADLVLSDMAPNLSGIDSIDQARAETLRRAVVEFCGRALKPGGTLLIKLFAGETAAAARQHLSACFEQVRTVKPEASRPQSKEIYALARGWKGEHKGRTADSARAPDDLYSATGHDLNRRQMAPKPATSNTDASIEMRALKRER